MKKIVLLCLFPFLCFSQEPIVGAIYWGAWNSEGFGNPAQMEISLSNPKYRDRIPFFGVESTERVNVYEVPPNKTRVTGVTSIRIGGDRQWVVDKEIKYAVDAGIDYFAMLYYGRHHYSHRLFKASQVAERKKIKFCWILDEFYIEEIDVIARDMGREDYQKVKDGRPLFYFINGGRNCVEIGDFLNEIKKVYKQLYPQAPNPYIVSLSWQDSDAHYCSINNEFMGDAFGSYGSLTGASLGDKSYEYIRAHEELGWRLGGIHGGAPKRVLWMSLGGDRRPRVDFPVSWERDLVHGYPIYPDDYWAETPSPEQVKSQLRKAINFVKSNPIICDNNSILVYAWNEHDEGGWFSPTIVPGTNLINEEKLRTIKSVLAPDSCKLNITPPSVKNVSVNNGESVLLEGVCTTGTLVWDAGLGQGNVRVTPQMDERYYARCVEGSCSSSEAFVDVTVKSECEESPFNSVFFAIKPENGQRPKLGFNQNGNPMTMQGKVFSGSGVGSVSGNELIYDLGYNHGYGFLTGVIGIDDASTCKDSKVKFYLRDFESHDFFYVSDELSSDKEGFATLDTFKIDIRRVRYLRMDVHSTNGKDSCALVNWALLELECPPQCEKDDVPTLTASTKQIIEGASVTLRAECSSGDVFWNDGSQGALREVSPTRNTSYSARCKTFGCDGSGFSEALEIIVNVNCALPQFVEEIIKADQQALQQISINKNASGSPLSLIDSTGTLIFFDKGFGIDGVKDVNISLEDKRSYGFFKVTVGIDPADTCSGPVRFRIYERVQNRDLLTTPLIYPVGKGKPNIYEMEVALPFMQWFALEILPENGKCGMYVWGNPRFECVSDLVGEVLDSKPAITDLLVYPNPSNSVVQVKYWSGMAGDATLKIVHENGVLLREEKVEVKAGNNEYTFIEIVKGKHILTIEKDGLLETKHILVY